VISKRRFILMAQKGRIPYGTQIQKGKWGFGASEWQATPAFEGKRMLLNTSRYRRGRGDRAENEMMLVGNKWYYCGHGWRGNRNVLGYTNKAALCY
jgi:hypothetical protein